MVPGLIEAHMHLFPGATEIDNLQLHGVHGFAALEQAIRAYAASQPGARLLIGQQADYTILSDEERVSAASSRPDHSRSALHHVLARSPHGLGQYDRSREGRNSQRARTLGPGNEIVMGDDGLADGELREGEAIQSGAGAVGLGQSRAAGTYRPAASPIPRRRRKSSSMISR